MFKLLHSEFKSVTGAAIIIAITTLASRIIGMARDRLFAHYFGAGPVMDAYYASFRIPDIIYNLLIAGALTAGFIPTFTKLFYNADKNVAWKLVNNVITILAISLSAISIVGLIFMPYLVKVIAPGLSGDTVILTIKFSRIMLISPLLLGISMVMGGVLQSLRQFFIYSLAPIFYNLGIIAGAIIFVPIIGIAGLAWGVALGALLHCLTQCYGVYKNGYRWRWKLNLSDAETLLIGRLMVPRSAGLAIAQLNGLIVTILASLLPVGSISVYSYASNLQAVPTGLIGIPFALAVFPVLSHLAAEKNQKKFIANLTATARQILFLVIPVSIIVLLLRAQIVRVVLGTGAFNWEATKATANTLAFFAFGLTAQSMIPLLARAFYALSNTKTPFIAGLISELISIIAALLLLKPLQVTGLALASSIGATLNMIILIGALRAETGHLEEEKFLTFIWKISIASILMGVTVQLLKNPLSALNLDRFVGILLHGLISGTMGLLVYGLICHLFKVEEIAYFRASLKKRWLRLWNIPAGIDEAEGL